MTIEQLQKIFPTAAIDTWHQHPNGGGWVQNTAKVDDSAHVSGSARVSGDAWVSGNAHVSGSARVSGYAHVSGNARVSGYAHVYGSAHVYGNAHVSGDAWVLAPICFTGTKHTIGVCASGIVRVGCHQMPIKEWLSKYESVGKSEGYSDAEIAEYKMYLDFISQWIQTVQPLFLDNKSAGRN